ncbi:hypothetical protein R84B8_00021 [Treponema sp. R8-4-B8]
MKKTEEYLEHILKLLRDNNVPDLPDEYAEDPLIVQIHEELKKIIHKKGETLAVINDKLRKEVEHVEILKESNAHFKFLASHDPLTGILNRRAFIEMAEIELATAAYLHVPCCLAMMDIDHFKSFNDTYGHLAGDEALRHAVKIVEAKLRKKDFMGRYGGEEFIFFFYDTDKETGLVVLERLRAYLSESPVSLVKGPVEIHASFGITEIEAGKSLENGYIQKLIHDADMALYAAKLAGRNRVVLFSPETELNRNSDAQIFQEKTENVKEEKAS